MYGRGSRRQDRNHGAKTRPLHPCAFKALATEDTCAAGRLVIAELSQLSGVTVRTLRDYVRRGLIRPFEFRGTSTRYPRRALLRLLALLRLKLDTKAALAEIRRELDAKSDPELEAWLRERGLSPAVLAALEADAPTPSAPPPPPEPTLSAAELGDAWHRIEILPGLELLLRSTASAAAKAAARRIYDEVLGAEQVRTRRPA